MSTRTGRTELYALCKYNEDCEWESFLDLISSDERPEAPGVVGQRWVQLITAEDATVEALSPILAHLPEASLRASLLFVSEDLDYEADIASDLSFDETDEEDEDEDE